MRTPSWFVPSLALLTMACHAPNPAPKPPTAPPTLLPAGPGELPRDSRDGQAVLLGRTDREAILAHRNSYQSDTAKVSLPEAWKARWRAIQTPCTLVVAFGSWCGDTQRELPDLLALMEAPNPFITVHFIGVYRDKRAAPEAWPKGIPPRPILKVPTFWLHALQPGGAWVEVGAIVENPPVKGQRMAQALVELLEKAK
jgi:hypothetical protein